MCGIVGMISKNKFGFNQNNLKVFELLLYMDTLRGDDSTGVFAVNNIGNVGIAKAAVTGEQFLKTAEWKKFNGELFRNGWCVIGHNRKATRGSVTDENAHPFWVDDKLVLVHNGSYYGSHDHLKKTNVDSHAIAHTIAEHGSEDIEGALKKINAAYALVWYDIEKKRLNVIRNDQRPLHFAETADAWYFASEYQMLDFALARERITVINESFSFVPYQLNTWELQSDHSSIVTTTDLQCKYEYVAPPSTGHSKSVHHGYSPPSNVVPLSTAMVNAFADPMKPRTLVEQPKHLVSTKVPLMPWMKTVTLRDSKALFEQYKGGQKLTVMVDDFIKAEDDDRMFTVTGNTLDENKIPVAFNVSKTLMDSLTSPDTDQVENAVFEITVSHPSWRRTDNIQHKDVEDAAGVMMLIGRDPLLRFDGRGHGLQ